VKKYKSYSQYIHMKLLLNNPAIINLVNEKVKKYKLIKKLQWKLIQNKVAVYRYYDIPNMRMHYNLCLWELKNQPRISNMMNKFKQKIMKKFELQYSIMDKIQDFNCLNQDIKFICVEYLIHI
tara:strand:- start:569 stop:937 length:369 start_codon:yes stop_codon:yes gene_type:complete